MQNNLGLSQNLCLLPSKPILATDRMAHFLVLTGCFDCMQQTAIWSWAERLVSVTYTIIININLRAPHLYTKYFFYLIYQTITSCWLHASGTRFSKSPR
jgi:hypothetical protein